MTSGLPRLRLDNLEADLDASLAQIRSDDTAVRVSRGIVERALEDGKAYYGINTGFGILAQKRIEPSEVERLQTNLLRSHAVGLGSLIPKNVTRLMLRLKVHALALGFSGVAPETLERLATFAERELIPAVPSRGSVGASGDLAPLAHMSLPLIGGGSFWDAAGRDTQPAEEVLRHQGLSPVTLRAKDGLALINGTQLMSGYGSFVLARVPALLKTADVIAASTIEALKGSVVPFDARFHEVRAHPGHGSVSSNVRRLLADSQIVESHRDCDKVQDPYSLRCVPQVHGASRDALAYASEVVEREINSVTDNPIVFPDGAILSGGNFHGQPLALALDHAAIALAEIASIAERRLDRLLAGHDGLPRLLLTETGTNSGLMVVQYTAAALVSENKILCHPASVDSIPTSLGQEDHVSMGSISAIKLLQVFENVTRVLGLELLGAMQALDFRQALRPGNGVAVAHDFVRERIAHLDHDEVLGDDIEKAISLVRDGELLAAVERGVGALD